MPERFDYTAERFCTRFDCRESCWGIDPLGWGYRATQKNRGRDDVWYYAMDRVLPGSYVAVAIDVEPYRVTGDADLRERARAAAVPVEIPEAETPLALRVVRLRPFVQGPQ